MVEGNLHKSSMSNHLPFYSTISVLGLTEIETKEACTEAEAMVAKQSSELII